MIGYAIRVAALEEKNKKDLIFAEKEFVEQNYPIPAVFHAYRSDEK